MSAEPDEAVVAALAEVIIKASYWWPREMISDDKVRDSRGIARAVLASPVIADLLATARLQGGLRATEAHEAAVEEARREGAEQSLVEVEALILARRSNLNATRDDREERRVRQGLRIAAEIVRERIESTHVAASA